MANTTEGRSDDVTEELVSNFNRNLNLLSHPEIGPYVTGSFRVRYGGLIKQFLCKPNVKKNLHFMHMMSVSEGTEEHFVHNEADNTRSANDILNFQVAKAAGILVTENAKKNLVEQLRSSLVADRLEKEFVDAIVNPFDESLTCEQYVAVFTNLHLLKSCGLAHDRMFLAILNDLRNSGDREKVVQLSARFYASILKSNDNFNSDSVREDFLKNCKKYANRAPLHKPDENLVAQIGATGVATLATIRQNALFNVKSFLVAERKKDKLYTPLEVYALRDSFPTLKFNAKQLERVAKAINSANKEPINLSKSFHNFPVQFSCFLCPSSDPSPSTGRKPPSPQPSKSHLEIGENASSPDQPTFHPPISFVDRVMGKFNVLRLEPKNSRAAVDTHFVNTHTCLTQSQAADLNGHSYIFTCPECLQNNFSESFICCAPHYESHNKILHSSTLTHFRVLTQLREVFKDDSCMLQIVDKFLLTICSFCRLLFPDKESRDIHIEKICIPRFVSLSTYYGEPITSTPVFKTSSTLEAEKQERIAHLVSCLKNISKHIIKGPQTVSANPSLPSTDRSTAATVGSSSDNVSKKLDLLSTLVLNETQMDINTFNSPRSTSPAPSDVSTVLTEPAALSSKNSCSTATIPAVLNPNSPTETDNESDSRPAKGKGGPFKSSRKGQKESKSEKRRQFLNLAREAIEEHKRGSSSGHNKHGKDDDDDDDDDDDNDNDGNNSPETYDVEENENGIEDEEMEPEAGNRNRMDVVKEGDVEMEETREKRQKEKMDDNRQNEERRREGGREEGRREEGRREGRREEEREEGREGGSKRTKVVEVETEAELEARTEGRRRANRGEEVEKARSNKRYVVVTEDKSGHTPELSQDRVTHRKSGEASTKAKSTSARRRIRYVEEEDDEEEEIEEEVRVVRRPRTTARMHSSGVLRLSKPTKKKTVPRVYFESDESRSPSPQSPPPSKRKKEVKTREIRPLKKKKPRTYMVIPSDSESD